MKLKVDLRAAAAPLAKRYYAIGEVSTLCGVKPHVLRYWEQEFPQLKPVKRRGNRRYYQASDVETVRQIQGLLYEQGYTIQGARLKLKEGRGERDMVPVTPAMALVAPVVSRPVAHARPVAASRKENLQSIRQDLEELLKRWPV